MPSACIFCGGQPLTSEHVFPQWVRKVLLASPRGFPSENRNIMATTLRGPPAWNSWATVAPLEFKVKAVCQACNNGWMSDVETAAVPYLKPMIEGEPTPVVLNQHAQSAVGTWAVLRAAMACQIVPGPTHLHQDWLTWLHQHHVASPDWTVWLGHYHGSKPAFLEVVNGVYLGPSSPFQQLRRYQGVFVTLVIGYLALKIFGMGGFRLGEPGSFAIGVSPSQKVTLNWPPILGMDDKSIIAFFEMGRRNADSTIRGVLPPL